jgi:RNA polymerase sigma-70 factor (ECF subfamily)
MNHPERRTEFAELLRLHQGRLYGYIHSLVRDLDDADDLFQQSAVILWNKFDDFDRARSFFSWACGIARFEVANFVRSRGRRKLYFTDELNLMLIEAAEQLPPQESEDRREALQECLEKLRTRDRELLRACYGDEDDSITAVADKRGRSSHSVYNSLRRIRRSLSECIERTMRQQEQPDLFGG